jgi:putative salt-induced outer membrane protein YdiY
MNSLTALTMKLTTKVAFQFGFNVRFDNAPAPGKKKTDTTTQAGLIINLI